MKSIMISVKPQWVSKILNKEKLVEIRKTMPKCELPCKVYIYCTKPRKWWRYSSCGYTSDELLWKTKDKIKMCDGFEFYYEIQDCIVINGKVVAEFTLNKIYTLERDLSDWLPKNRYDVSNDLLKDINLNQNELWNYGQGKILYAWHIDDLKVYDKPKELSEFSGFIPNNKCEKHENGFACEKCDAYDKEHETCLALYYAHREIKRPPQSYCYVEELENE